MVSQTETHAGEVTRVSGYGFQLNGQTRWYNLSKFVQGLALPAVGDIVEVSLSRGYVVQISRRTGGAVSDAPAPAAPPIQSTRQARPPFAAAESFETESDDLPFEPPAEPSFIDPNTLPFDEPLEDLPEDLPEEEAVWQPRPSWEPASSSLPERDRQAVRMQAITNAVAILSSGGRSCDVEEVLHLAARLEDWIDRE
jgi:hypothetical protein